MHPHANLLPFLRHRTGDLLPILLLLSATILLAAPLADGAGAAAAWTLFQSPAATPTPVPTDTPVPIPTDTAAPAPSATPQPTTSVTPVPPATQPAETSIPTSPPPTEAPQTPTGVGVQMPLLPPTASSGAFPTPAPTATPQSLLSPESVGWAVVIAFVALAGAVGLFLGGVMRNLTQQP